MHLELFLGVRIQHAYGGGVLGAVEHGIVIAERRDGHVERPAVGFVHGQLQGYQRWGHGPIPVNSGLNKDVFDEVASIDDFIVHGFCFTRNDGDGGVGCHDNSVLLADITQNVGREVQA